MAKVLYISLTGMTEPLGESQVIQYLLELAKTNSIYLLSFEKSKYKNNYEMMMQRLNEANIYWKFLQYSNRYGVLSTSFQIMVAFLFARKLIKKEKLQIIHARSLIPAVIGMLLKKVLAIQLVFDIRGFTIDEKIVDGRLKPHSKLSYFLKKLEASVYKNADHIVTLTHVSKPIIQTKYSVKKEKITVIPTCANLQLFKVMNAEDKLMLKKNIGFSLEDFVILHNGSLNNWVDFEAELKLFEQLALLNKKVRFLFLNKDQHQLILSHLENYSIQTEKYKIVSSEFNRVSHYLNLSDLCVFFIKPSFAKQASAPTKFAELVACHINSVSNKHYGDMEYYFKNYEVGVLLDLQEVHTNPKSAAIKVLEFIEKYKTKKTDQEFKRLSSEHFSKDIAVERYQSIYDRLLRTTSFL